MGRVAPPVIDDVSGDLDPLGPGWFVTARGRPPGSRSSGHRRTRTGLLATLWTGWALVVAGLCSLLAPVALAGGSLTASCGLPILGRYDAGSPPDLAATAFTACWNQAQVRRHVGVPLLLAGLVVLAVASGVLGTRAGQAWRNRNDHPAVDAGDLAP